MVIKFDDFLELQRWHLEPNYFTGQLNGLSDHLRNVEAKLVVTPGFFSVCTERVTIYDQSTDV